MKSRKVWGHLYTTFGPLPKLGNNRSDHSISYRMHSDGIQIFCESINASCSECEKVTDVHVSLPTGYGKSLCYAVLPRVFDLTKFG